MVMGLRSHLLTLRRISIRSSIRNGWQSLSVARSAHSSSSALCRQHVFPFPCNSFISQSPANFVQTPQPIVQPIRLSSRISGTFGSDDAEAEPASKQQWSTAVKDAEKLVGLSSSLLSLRYLLSEEISIVLLSLRKLIGITFHSVR